MKYISVEEAGKKLNLSARSIRNYCAQGRIPGAILSGKTWLIPSDAKKPNRTVTKLDDETLKNLEYGEKLVSFLNESPVSYYAINNVRKTLLENGYKEIYENEKVEVSLGDKVFFIRNDSTLIALNIGNNPSSFHIIASHCDSPCFKIKPQSDNSGLYNKINVEPYGGMIINTWLDRPLSIAGRVIVNEDDSIESRLVNLSNFTVMIPNTCIHFNRDLNNGYVYNFAVDMQPFFSMNKEKGSFKELLANKMDIDASNIINYDLYLYNKEQGIVWGENKEFVSSARLDDLQCVYTSLMAFVESNNENNINVLYIADNEEVGSLSRQGADGDFLDTILKRIANSLNLDYELLLAKSFMISADNAHAVHPNKGSLSDEHNQIFMNQGIAIKYNASNSYTTDALSSAVFQKICNKKDVPVQFFTNRSDVRGGSTLGRFVLGHTSIMSIDVGLAQLAMHSSYETAGSKDIYYAIEAFKGFYCSQIEIVKNKVSIK